MSGTGQQYQVLCLLDARGNLHLICSTSFVGALFLFAGGLLLFDYNQDGCILACCLSWNGCANGCPLHVALVRRLTV